jgi:gliding motility-associated-like protein
MKKTLTVFLFSLFLFPLGLWATHNRAGEITYEHISGLTYRVTVTTYTNESSVTADRCKLDVFFGDGTSETVKRVNGSSCGTPGAGGCQHCGVSIGNNTKLNIYITEHTYPSTGSYRITMEDPNRNQGVVNIPNSVQVVFFIYAELNIFPGGTANSSPILTNPPVDDACLNVRYEHNPGAVDQDISNNGLSDSLSYKLVTCLGNGGAPIPNYTLPDKWAPGPNNVISIDPVTGTLSWDSPKIQGEYNVAILIEEWRKIGGAVTKIGSVLRDLQITVDVCQANNPPQIRPINDTCVTATESMSRTVTAIDNDFLPPGFTERQTVELSATGDPFYVQGSKASFPVKSGQRIVSQDFTWSTKCNHIRSYPYFVVFRAEDNYTSIRLTDYLDWRINVIAPAPVNINAEPFGAGINVSWGYSQCTNATGYRIYRKMDSIGYIAPDCETGIPASTGYTLVGSTVGAGSTLFYDDDGGKGLISGQKYCYMVYAYFDDGAESYPSQENCATLKKEVPIITRVSVNTTDVTNGSDTVKWAKPTELDIVKYPGPYQYKIIRKENNGSFVTIASSIISSDLNLIDTVYVDNGINTKENQYTYRIEIYSGQTLIGPSRSATSPWLKLKPLDNRMELSLNIDVPWQNKTMYIYRQNSSGNFVYLDSANTLIYTDSNLINGNEYCYYITTKGEYSDKSLEFPLLNNSQIRCDTVVDKQAPCPPQNLKVESECELFYNDLSWLNPNDVCDTTDDVVSYNIYYKSFFDGVFTVIEKVQGATNTSILFDNLETVAGCYTVTAIDSFNNESPMSNMVCVDNCPFYELPNVFTPGKDGQNDFYIPMPKWRYVKEVDMNIYNRWGEIVYTAADPALGWDGSNKDGVALPNGTYYYVCKVYEIRLEGIVERILKGTVTLLRESGQPSN